MSTGQSISEAIGFSHDGVWFGPRATEPRRAPKESSDYRDARIMLGRTRAALRHGWTPARIEKAVLARPWRFGLPAEVVS